jgi:soluble lytic murein transglycosylase-like protein
MSRLAAAEPHLRDEITRQFSRNFFHFFSYPLVMINSSRNPVNIFVRLTVLLAVMVIFTASAAAQDNKKSATASADASAAVSDYKSSLSALQTLYQNEVQRIETQNGKLKDLYTQGIIARVEMDKSDKELADARAKVEEVAKQIAEANKPPAILQIAANDSVSNQNWTTGNARVDGLIRFYGNQQGVDPFLIYCLMSQESKFTSGAISPKGAMGLMQLMPGTAARYGVTNPYDVAQSISGGTRYLKDLLKMFNGRIDLALAGYNAGEGAVMKYGNTIPPYSETQNYVKLIIKRYGKRAS